MAKQKTDETIISKIDVGILRRERRSDQPSSSAGEAPRALKSLSGNLRDFRPRKGTLIAQDGHGCCLRQTPSGRARSSRS